MLAKSGHNLFNCIIGIIDTSDSIKIFLNYDTLNEIDFSKFHKQIQITVIKYVVGNNKVLLAQLRRYIIFYSPLLVGKVVETRFNTLSILAFLEFMYPIRITVFSLN